MGQPPYPPRRELTPAVAARLAEAHRRTGATYSQVAAVKGIDGSCWRRLTLGGGAPAGRLPQDHLRS